MKTPPTIPAPLPTDHRLLSLARLLKVTKRDALAATVEAWAWIQAQATEGIVPSPVALLDGVAEIEGFGEAAVAVGLVGTADGHIVAPVELRQADAQVNARRAGTADDDARDRERRKARDRQRRRRSGSRLTGKPKTPAPLDAAPAAATMPSRRSRRLGTVAPGQDVMLIWSKVNGEWFYKVTGAVPGLTGTVTDQDNPTLADALKALCDARLTQQQQQTTGLDSPTFSPSMAQLVEAGRREQADRQAAAVAAAHVDEGNVAFAQAAAEDAEQGDAEPAAERPTSSPDDPAERDCHAPVTPVTRDKRDCHVSVTVATDAKPEHRNGLDADFCHASVTVAAPSSSSSSVSYENEVKENITTTRATADLERDALGVAEQDDIFARYLQASGTGATRALQAPSTALDPETAALLQRFANALGSTPDAVRKQGRYQPDILAARLVAAGIDPKTGFALAATDTAGHAPTSPQDAPGRPVGDETGVQAGTPVQAAGAIAGAPGEPPLIPPSSRHHRHRIGLHPAGDIAAARLGDDLERDDATGPRRRERDREDETARLKDATLRAIAAAG